jgi:FdhD protein
MSSGKGTVRELNVFSCDGKTMTKITARIVREAALDVRVNGKKTAVIACAGNHLEELAAGFLRSEKMILRKKDIEEIEVDEKKYRVNIILKNKRDAAETFVKNIASSGARGRSAASLTLQPLSPYLDIVIEAKIALRLMDGLLEKSILHNETHGTHCSALARRGNIVALREDIGRHNTIDMLGGYALFHNVKLSSTLLLTTGRISAEIVYKVWNLGIPIIISHSAPTTKALELVRRANITLIGYVRGGRMNIYSHERRVKI